VGTLGDRVDTDDDAEVLYKPPVTAAVAAAKQSYLGRVYLDWARWPVVEDRGTVPAPGSDFPPQPGWHTVEFEDLRFGYSPLIGGAGRSSEDPPLSGSVYVGRGREIEGMFMSGREQK